MSILSILSKFCQLLLPLLVLYIAYIYQHGIWLATHKFSPEYIPYILQNITNDGGSYYQFSNNRIIEYFSVGASANDLNAIVIFNFHGYFTDGKICHIFEEDVIAINKNRSLEGKNLIRMICPSTPGWGYSSPVPYRSYLDGIPLEFLDYLKVKKFHLMSMSFGTGDCLGLAINTLMNNNKVNGDVDRTYNILSLTLNVPFVSSMDTYSAANNSILYNIVYQPIIDRLWGHLLSNFNLTESVLNNPEFSVNNVDNNDNEEQIKLKKKILKSIVGQIERSMGYQWEGLFDGFRVIRDKDLNQVLYNNKHLLQHIPKITVYHGEKDEVAGTYHVDFLKRVFLPSTTEYFEKINGTHFDSSGKLELIIKHLGI